jgi:hypothetical protein
MTHRINLDPSSSAVSCNQLGNPILILNLFEQEEQAYKKALWNVKQDGLRLQNQPLSLRGDHHIVYHAVNQVTTTIQSLG